MTNQQIAELSSFERVQSFNTKYQAQLSTIEEYEAEKAKFDEAVLGIKNAGIAQTEKHIDGDTTNAAKKTMARVITKYCLRAKVKANSFPNDLLVKQLLCSENSILKAGKVEAVQIATNRRNVLNNNLSILTNIKPEYIAEIDAAIAAYDKIKDAPTENKITKKSNITDQLPGFFQKAHDAEDNMYDLTYSYFSDTKPEMVHEMEAAMQVIHTGARHTSVSFDCVADEDNTPITDFTISNQTSDSIHVSEDGVVTLAHHRAGQFNFTIKSPTRAQKVITVVIKRRVNNHFTVRLQK
jgi:hypothetical protein